MKIIKKIIIVLLVCICLNTLFSNFTFGFDEGIFSDEKNFGISFTGIIDTALGFLVYPWKKIFIVPGIIANVILSEIASVGSSSIHIVTLESILFNELPLIDVNIFSQTTTATGAAVSQTIQDIRQGVASWYYAFRNFAIVFSLAMLIYTGIRMAIDNIAEQKAKDKQMLINWIISLGIAFVLHYFIIFVLNANTMLVNALTPNAISDSKDFMNTLLLTAFLPTLVQSWGAAIMYSILLVITLVFLIVYIKRMLMVCFLTIIAPIISITYSVDKSGNKKSEILNSWLKEFCYNVLIQPFHCIIYIVFVGTAMELMYKSGALNFGAMILAIACILCIFIGEKMIRTIFGFNKSKSVAQKIFTGSMVTSAISNIKTVRDARSEDEEPEPPSVMPDGEDTEYEIDKATSKVKLKASKQIEEEENITVNSKNQKQKIEKKTSNSKQNQKVSSKQGKIATTVKKMGKAYVRGVSSVVGYEEYKHKQDVKRKKKMPTVQEQFLIASENYRRSVNPGMTDKQLARQMEIIMKTPMKDLKDSKDVLYKSWITHTQKSLTSKGSKDAIQDMKDMIEEHKS